MLGQPVSGISIVFEQGKDKKGKTIWSKKVVKTNAAGKFEVQAWMKTGTLQYWLIKTKKGEIGVPVDTNVVNIVVNDGRGETPDPLGDLLESLNSGN